MRKLISSLPVQPLPVQYSGQAQKSGARHEWDLGHPGQVAAGSSFVLENNNTSYMNANAKRYCMQQERVLT